MKQLIVVGLLTLVGTAGTIAIDPFCGVAVYYLFAVLRPQFIWVWSLPPDIQWSRYVALTTIAAAGAMQMGILRPRPAHRSQREARSWTGRLMFLFLLWVTLSYVFARNREAGDFTYSEYLKIFAMFAVSKLILATTRQLWILLMLTALALGYISYEVNFLYLVQGNIGIAKNGYGGLDNNGAALMLAMGVPLCLFIWDGMRKPWRWAFLALIPVILHAVLMTYSRGAMVSLIVATPLLVSRCRRRAQLSPFLLLLVLAMPMLAGPEIQARFFTLRQHDQDESANSRRASWAAAWKMALDNPIFGVGVRNSNLFSFQYGADMEGRTIHNQYLQIAADNGFVGMGLYLAIITSVWFDTRHARRMVAGRDDVDALRTRAVADGAEGALAVFCIGGVFLSLEIFELPYLLFLLGNEAAVLVDAAEPAGGS